MINKIENEPIVHTLYESKEMLFNIIPVIETQNPSPLVEVLDSILEHCFNYFQPQEGQ